MMGVLPALAALVFLLVCRYLFDRLRRQHLHLPPGPPSIPVIGNVHQLPIEHQERTFFAWGKQYGGIVFARLFHQPAIVINSVKVARDLMEKRSANYSDRPPFVLLEAMGWSNVPTQLPYGEIYRKHRRWMQDAFIAKDALLSYRALQLRETHVLLAALLHTPDAYEAHARRHVAALVAEIVYGHQVTGPDDEYVRLAERTTRETVETGSPGSNILGLLVDFFPVLLHYPTWLPGAGFRAKISEVRELVDRLQTMPYEGVKARMAAGTAAPCFVANILEQRHLTAGAQAGKAVDARLSKEEEVDLKGAASAFYAAGTDTSTSVITAFLLCMVLNPRVFRKAQAEVDAVVGRARLPGFEDREALVYVQCVMKEVYRWSAVVPLAIPHRAVEGDTYEGYHIPRGSMIIPNIWGMTRNEDMYPSPEEFCPERYMPGDVNYVDTAEDPSDLVFGFGRRFCPGQQLADGNFFLIASNILATMDVGKAVDEKTGKEVTPSGEFVSGFVRHPKSFPYRIQPRSEEARVLIEQVNSLI